MIWLPHKKYTAEYLNDQLMEIALKVRRETRRMIYIATAASAAFGVMAYAQMTYCYGL